MGPGGTLTQHDGIPEYAERFAAAGIAALTFGYRNWGTATASQGVLRQSLASFETVGAELALRCESAAATRQSHHLALRGETGE